MRQTGLGRFEWIEEEKNKNKKGKKAKKWVKKHVPLVKC
jgi:hypothetical protein